MDELVKWNIRKTQMEVHRLQNDPSIFARVNSAILVSITANGFDVVYSPAANCILATFYTENRHFYLY